MNGSVGIVVDFMRPTEARASQVTDSESDTESQSLTALVSHREPTSDGKREARPDPLYENSNWPIVRFTNGVRAMMAPLLFTHEGPDGEVLVSREQVSEVCCN